jgi:hypothetical protein
MAALLQAMVQRHPHGILRERCQFRYYAAKSTRALLAGPRDRAILHGSLDRVTAPSQARFARRNL